MNKKTLEKLRTNPYYTLSDDQEKLFETSFNYDYPTIHNNDVPVHKVKIKRRKRKNG